MKFIKSDLLTLLVSLFILSGCDNPAGVGLDVGPDIALDSKLLDTSTVFTKLQKQDRIVSNFANQSALGYFNDPVFGKTTASIAVGLTMPSVNYSFGKSPVLDSAVLVLPFANFYGDSLHSNFTAEVRQLDEVLFNASSPNYYSDKIWLKNSTVIGSHTFTANYTDSISIQAIIAGAADSMQLVPRQLRIKIDANFVKNNIINLDSLNKISNTAFNNFIKGLYISINKGATTGEGGLFTFNTKSSGAARLDVFYKTTNTSGTIDTLLNSFLIDGENGNAATEISWDMDGTVVKSEIENPTKNNHLLYLKGLGGTAIKVDFPYLSKLKSLGKNIAINRAELVFTVDGSPANASYNPISRMRIYRWDIANRPQRLPDENQADPRYMGPGFIDGFYNKDKKTYTFNLTGYIQDLISGRTKDFGTFITANDYTATDALSTLGRSVIGGGDNSTYKVKLRVFYTDQK